MSEMTPKKHEVQAARRPQVVDITPGATNQVWIFDAADRRSENGRSHSE
jgi:hypothetical protein